MINEVDVDGNGTVEFAEFVILMTNKVKEISKQDEIKEAFDVLDKEKDELITVKELKYFMRKVAHIKLSNEEAEAMIEYATKDKERRGVTFADFQAIVEEMGQMNGSQQNQSNQNINKDDIQEENEDDND